MNNIHVTVDAKMVSEFLEKSPEKMKRAVSNIINKATLLIERGAKQLSPVDTGRLRSSIFSQIRPMSATVSTNTNYARYVHDGTRFIHARPFMKDAASKVTGELKSLVDAEVDSALR